MVQLQLHEWVPAADIGLTLVQRDLLQRAFPSLTIRPHQGRRDSYDVAPGSEVGTAQIGDLSVQIQPKIPIERLLFLLAYAADPQAWRRTEFGFQTEPGVFESVIPGFVFQVRRAVSRGLLHGYRPVDDTLTTVRGRIRVTDQLHRHFNLPIPLEVHYDDFTPDIEENRLLRAAIEQLSHLSIRRQEIRNALRAADRILAPISRCHYHPARLPTIRYTRLNAHYRAAVELAKLILRSSSFDFERGIVISSNFVVDMNAVFEDFVVTGLREALELREGVFRQGQRSKTRLWLDHAGRIPLKPDISWWEHGKCVFVGDVKYKRITSTRVPNADVYQLLAYATAADLPGGLLIYPSQEAPRMRHRIVHADKTIFVSTIDVTGTPEETLAELLELAETVRGLRAYVDASARAA